MEDIILENIKLKKELKIMKRKKLLVDTLSSLFFDNFDLKYLLYKPGLEDYIYLNPSDMSSKEFDESFSKMSDSYKLHYKEGKIKYGDYLSLLDLDWNAYPKTSFIEHKNIYEVEWIIHGYYRLEEDKIKIVSALHHDIIKMVTISSKNIGDFGFLDLDSLIEYYKLENYKKENTNIYLLKLNKIK